MKKWFTLLLKSTLTRVKELNQYSTFTFYFFFGNKNLYYDLNTEYKNSLSPLKPKSCHQMLPRLAAKALCVLCDSFITFVFVIQS